MRTFRDALPPLLLLLALVGLWELLAQVLTVDDYILPAPSEIGQALAGDRSLLAEDAWVTLVELVLGFLIALVAGIAVACLLNTSDLMRKATYPLLIASQTVPVIVLAPILVIVMGYNIGPKLAVVTLICFFPIAVNTFDGLRSVDPELVKAMRTLDGSRWSIFKRVELPSSLPYMFSGARVAATVAAIGAVFGEWVGSDAGLGHLMLQATPLLQTDRVFAAIVILTLFSVGLFALVSLAERLLVPWSNRYRRQ